jgi:hypothetical protein
MRFFLLPGSVVAVVALNATAIDTDICPDVLVMSDPVCSEIFKGVRDIDSVVALFDKVGKHALPAAYRDLNPLTPLEGILLDSALGM